MSHAICTKIYILVGMNFYTYSHFTLSFLQAFGFCEFSNPDAGLRAVRILNGYEIADKELVVKVDAKTKRILLDYLKAGLYG